jgi:hypothetical protein
MGIMWTTDRNIDDARNHKNWTAFHRECGKLNFYIEKIEKVDRQYAATAFKLASPAGPSYNFIPLGTGGGKSPIDACVDAYRLAVAAKHMPDTHLEKLFSESVEDDEDLIGDLPVPTLQSEDDEEDLIG